MGACCGEATLEPLLQPVTDMRVGACCGEGGKSEGGLGSDSGLGLGLGCGEGSKREGVLW